MGCRTHHLFDELLTQDTSLGLDSDEATETQVWLDFARDCGLSEEHHKRLAAGYKEAGKMLSSIDGEAGEIYYPHSPLPTAFCLPFLQVGDAPGGDFCQVPPEPFEDFLPLAISEFLPKFIESKVDNVVMVQFLRAKLIAEVKPDAMQEVNFLRGEAGRVGT